MAMLLMCDHRIPCVPHWSPFPKGLARLTNGLECIKSTPVQCSDYTYIRSQKSYSPSCWQRYRRQTMPRRIWRPYTQQWPRPGSCRQPSGCPRSFARTFCEIISKMRILRKVGLQTSLRRRTTARKLFYHWFDGPPANKSPPAQQRPGFLLVGNEEKLLLSDRRMGVVLTKSLRLGRYSP